MKNANPVYSFGVPIGYVPHKPSRSKYKPHVGKKQERKALTRFERSVAPHPEDAKG